MFVATKKNGDFQGRTVNLPESIFNKPLVRVSKAPFSGFSHEWVN